ncbi:MAG TPA: hypothetical protein VNX46_02330 [Candidatus Acidoferrum sp.]|jgi:hypothetical protein|nr:hypothetical protein [Candidatus Acidoferrum sp.]
MRTSDIVAIFGVPEASWELDKNKQMWYYDLAWFPAGGEMRGHYVIGFDITLTNGQLVNWGGSYADFSAKQTQRVELAPAGNNTNRPIMKWFLISPNSVPSGHFVDTVGFPKIGFIPPSPSLSITQLMGVTLEERVIPDSRGSNVPSWSCDILSFPNDAERIKSLTKTSVGKRLLITINNEPAAAPVIIAPIEGGSFFIECTDPSQLHTLTNQLAQMLPSSE